MYTLPPINASPGLIFLPLAQARARKASLKKTALFDTTWLHLERQLQAKLYANRLNDNALLRLLRLLSPLCLQLRHSCFLSQLQLTHQHDSRNLHAGSLARYKELLALMATGRTHQQLLRRQKRLVYDNSKLARDANKLRGEIVNASSKWDSLVLFLCKTLATPMF